MVIAFSVALSVAKAADLNTGWIDTGSFDMFDASFGGGDSSWIDTGSFDMFDASFGGGDSSWIDTGYYDMYESQYSSYSSPSYSSPSSYSPQYRYIPEVARPYVNQQPSNVDVNTNTNVNTNTCTAVGSCSYTDNSVVAMDDHSVVNIDNNTPAPQPYISYQPEYPTYPQYDVCLNLPGIQTVAPQGYYTHQGNCVAAQYNQPPMPYPTPTPYVSLSSTPYTGLEMGPVATALYWGFLVLWGAVAAYLIAVKKVQNKLVAGINGFLFPATPATASVSHDYTAPRSTFVAATPARNNDAIDPFIQSQINRSR
jgi:hypothetical protein